MPSLSLVWAGIFFVAHAGMLVVFLVGRRKMIVVDRLATPTKGPWPGVSIVIPARDEELHIEQALQSVLALDYPDYEVIVVDDRSTDRTPEILARLKIRFPQLRSARIDELPPGWLGKNYALQWGASQSSKEWVLFTDADVYHAPHTLKKVMGFVHDNKADHVSVLAGMRAPASRVLEALIVFFGTCFMIGFRPWDVRPGSKRYMGVGAFNMLKRSLYEKIGRHEQLRMRPDDDMKLGLLVHRSGARQFGLGAQRDLWVEWYPTLKACVRGLEKNMFAGFDYNIAVASAAALSLVMIYWAPFFFLIFGKTPAEQALGACALLYAVLVARISAQSMGLHRRAAWLLPFSAALFSGIILRTMVKNLREGGLQWRETFYPLDELKKNRV